MKGLAKVMKRTPHIVTSRVGMSAKSTDVEFDHLKRKFEAMERLVHQLARESKTYLDAAKSRFPRTHPRNAVVEPAVRARV